VVIREEGYGLRITVYQLKKNFIAGNLSLTLLPKLVLPGWQNKLILCSPGMQRAPTATHPSAAASNSLGPSQPDPAPSRWRMEWENT